jgi:hypothetical protein
MSNIKVLETVIPQGHSDSGVVGIGENLIVGIIMPATWTTALLGFKGGDNIDDLRLVYDTATGDPLTLKNAANGYIPVDPTLWLGVKEVVIVSGGGSPVVQTDSRTLKVIVAGPAWY